jgi:inorganic pyrophosphatase
MEERGFWQALDRLVSGCSLVVDRPAGTVHPRYTSFTYPLDYGYLAGTRSGDGGGIDVWVGSLPERTVAAVICTVDLEKGDAELKILVGCTPHETQAALDCHNRGGQSGMLVVRAEGSALPSERNR